MKSVVCLTLTLKGENGVHCPPKIKGNKMSRKDREDEMRREVRTGDDKGDRGDQRRLSKE